MRIAFLLALCFSALCDARLTGIDYEIYPEAVWQLSDGTYLVKIKTDTDEIHDFICERLRHSFDCQCTPQPHRKSSEDR